MSKHSSPAPFQHRSADPPFQGPPSTAPVYRCLKGPLSPTTSPFLREKWRLESNPAFVQMWSQLTLLVDIWGPVPDCLSASPLWNCFFLARTPFPVYPSPQVISIGPDMIAHALTTLPADLPHPGARFLFRSEMR